MLHKKPDIKIRIKIINVNFRIKHKSKTMWEVMRNLVMDFIIYFVTSYMRKCPIHVKSAQRTTQIHFTSLEEVSKKSFMTNNLQ